MVSHRKDNGTEPNDSLSKDPVQLFREGKRVEAAVRESLRQVRILHKKMGVPLVGWRDGQMVSIPPEEIEIDEPGGAADHAAQK